MGKLEKYQQLHTLNKTRGLKMHKKILFLMFTLLAFILLNNSSDSQASQKTERPLFEEKEGCNIIRYSNVIMNINSKQIKIPIYGGAYGDVYYDELLKYKKHKDESLLILCIDAGKKGVNITFWDMMNFYKNSFFKDIDIYEPSVIGNEGGPLIIWYDFNYKSLPCALMISIDADEYGTRKKIKSMGYNPDIIKSEDLKMNMIQFDEKAKGYGIMIVIGQESGFKK